MKRNASIGMFYLIIFVICVAIAALTSCNKKEQKALNSEKWENSIFNKDNFEFIIETAFNENVLVENVTQEMFNKRYIIK